MLALEYTPRLPAYAAARITHGAGGPLALLRLAHRPAPARPGDGWVRLRPRLAGICGSDVAILTGEASAYLGALASAPFVPGHEVFAEVVEDVEGWPAGTRVAVEPLLHCAVRGVRPPCRRCAAGEPQGCESVGGDGIAAGLQSGYCAATGGGWGTEMVAHTSQLHRVPDALDDADAMMVEPLACALHAVLRTAVRSGDAVLVLGAGTVGLLVVAALRHAARPGRVIVTAKHSEQSARARMVGADTVVAPDELLRTVRFHTRARIVEGRATAPFLLGGADLSFECTGSARGLHDAMRCTRSGGTVVLVGMPGQSGIDLAPAWQRELVLRGAYGYGRERGRDGGFSSTFELAIGLAGTLHPGRLVAPPYPLERWREAVDHAVHAGRRGDAKVAFAPEPEAVA